MNGRLEFPSINLMENVVRLLAPAPITKWELEPRAVRFNYCGSRYRVGILSMGGVLIDEVIDGVLSSGTITRLSST